MSGIYLMSVEGAESSCTAYYYVRALISVPRHTILLLTSTLRFFPIQCHLIPDYESASRTGGTGERTVKIHN
jgi:hypothetical protein